MNKHITFLLFTLTLLFLGNGVKAQNLKIEGWGNNIGGKTLRLIATQDNLTNLESTIASQKIAQTDSTFSFSTLIDHSCVMRLQIESFSYSFFAQKGGYYRLHILPFNFGIADSVNTLFYEVPLSIIIDSSNDEDLNQQLYTIDSIVESYLEANKKELLFYHSKKSLDSLKNSLVSSQDSLDLNKQTLSQKYISDYNKYSLASLAYASKTSKPQDLKASLFFNKPILYDNIGYMNCFQQIYSNYFSSGNKHISTHSLEHWLMDNNYFALIDSLGLDSLLRNEVFRELVFLQGAKEMLLSSSYDKLQVQNLLDKFISQSKFPYHRAIAKNILTLYNQKATSNITASTFTLKDIDNNSITLDKYHGKPLIISFVRLNDISSLRELDMLQGFVDSLSSQVNFLTIACDRTLDALYNFKVNTKKGASYKWDFAHFSGNWELLEKYNVRVFPTFVFVDKDGIIIQNPMPLPSEGSLIPLLEQNRIKK